MPKARAATTNVMRINECNADICKNGTVYRCNSGTLATQGDKCPEVIKDNAGSCASAFKCKECDENVTSLSRRCVSPTDYYICQNGLWSNEKVTCPDNRFCDDKTYSCINQLSSACYNNDNGIGQIWTYADGKLQSKECPNAVSCNDDNTDCGECFDGTTKCENNVYSICSHGKYQESACPLGLGCHTNENGRGVCNECNEDKCVNENSTSKSEYVGKLTRCVNHSWDISEKCQIDSNPVLCYSETQCPECKNGMFQCKDSDTMQTCVSGKWNDIECKDKTPICDPKSNLCTKLPYSCSSKDKICAGNVIYTCHKSSWQASSCALGCYDSKQCIVCPNGATECTDSKTLRTCLNNAWTETKCESGCLTDENGNAKC